MIEYDFTSQSLSGSYDNRISIQLFDTEFISIEDDIGSKFTKKITSQPYIVFEFSIHKFFMGHNIFGGSNDLHYMLKHFYNYICTEFDLYLPCFMQWEIQRIDISYVFNIPFINRYFQYINNCKFPRRNLKKMIYDGTVYFPGSTTTIKLYDKHKEFKAHDYKKLKKSKKYGLALSDELLFNSKNVLRCEVEIHKRKLIYDINKQKIKSSLVLDMNSDYLMGVYDMEIKKIMEIREENRIITDIVHIQQLVTPTVYATYVNLSTLGEEDTKKMMSKATFLRHKKILRDFDICWETSNIHYDDDMNEVIQFLPYRDSKYCIDTDLIKAAAY